MEFLNTNNNTNNNVINDNKNESENKEELTIKKILIEEEKLFKILDLFMNKISAININNIPLILKTNQTEKSYIFLINKDLNIDVINKTLKLNEKNILDFLKNFYFYNFETFVKELFGEGIAIQTKPLKWEQNQSAIIVEF